MDNYDAYAKILYKLVGKCVKWKVNDVSKISQICGVDYRCAEHGLWIEVIFLGCGSKVLNDDIDHVELLEPIDGCGSISEYFNENHIYLS